MAGCLRMAARREKDLTAAIYCMTISHGQNRQAGKASGRQTRRSALHSSNKGGTPQVVVSGKTGWTVPFRVCAEISERGETMRQRQQKGCVYHQGKSWFLRYMDTVLQL